MKTAKAKDIKPLKPMDKFLNEIRLHKDCKIVSNNYETVSVFYDKGEDGLKKDIVEEETWN